MIYFIGIFYLIPTRGELKALNKEFLPGKRIGLLISCLNIAIFHSYKDMIFYKKSQN